MEGFDSQKAGPSVEKAWTYYKPPLHSLSNCTHPESLTTLPWNGDWKTNLVKGDKQILFEKLTFQTFQ